MRRIFAPMQLKGVWQAPPSKSISHRLLFLSLRSRRRVETKPYRVSSDLQETLNILEVLGKTVERRGDRLFIRDSIPKRRQFHLRESASSLRFLIPILALSSQVSEIQVEEKLWQRGLRDLDRFFQRHGVRIEHRDQQIRIQGPLLGEDFALEASSSSQYASGLLLALVLREQPFRLHCEQRDSRPYLRMTAELIRRQGVDLRMVGDIFQATHFGEAPDVNLVEGDHSHAAFFHVAKALGSSLTMENLDEQSLQGDAIFPALMELRDVDLSDYPDLLPPLALYFALRPGESHIRGIGRLRFKESDRFRRVAELLNQLGAEIECREDAYRIQGVSSLQAAACTSHGDHRLAMMLAMAAHRMRGELLLEGDDAVDKSYPAFWDDLINLGGKIVSR